MYLPYPEKCTNCTSSTYRSHPMKYPLAYLSWHIFQFMTLNLDNSKGTWSLDECLNEMTVVRSDISSLLQPRPKIPKRLPPPRDPKGKGRGKGHLKGTHGKGAGKGKTKGSTFEKRNNWCTWGFHNNQRVTLCMKFNAGECNEDQIVIIIMGALFDWEMDAHVCKTIPPRITKGPPDSGQTRTVLPMKMLAPQFILILQSLTKISLSLTLIRYTSVHLHTSKTKPLRSFPVKSLIQSHTLQLNPHHLSINVSSLTCLPGTPPH